MAVVPLGGCLGFVYRVPHLRRRGCQDQVWPVIVTSRRSASARTAMTGAGAAGCITRSPPHGGPGPGLRASSQADTRRRMRDRLPARPACRPRPRGRGPGRDRRGARHDRGARAAAADARLRFTAGTAERLPWPAATFDLVVSTTSFDHWTDQRAGLAECARVLAPGGCLVLADLFSALLLPTLLAGRRGKARTRRRATHLLTAAGLHSPQWHRLYAVIIQAVTATK